MVEWVSSKSYSFLLPHHSSLRAASLHTALLLLLLLLLLLIIVVLVSIASVLYLWSTYPVASCCFHHILFCCCCFSSCSTGLFLGVPALGVVGLWFFGWSCSFGCCWFVVCFVGVPALGVVGLWFVLLEFKVWVLLVCGLFCWSSRFGYCWFVNLLLLLHILRFGNFCCFPFWVRLWWWFTKSKLSIAFVIRMSSC